MTLSDWSEGAAGKHSWSTSLYTILRPVPRPLSAKFANSCSRYRHSPGDIWRHTLAVSVYHDLAGSALKHHSPQSVIWRRFVRLDHLGLSGVVFYEIPIPPSPCSGSAREAAGMPRKTESPNTARGALALRVRRTHPVVAPPRVTLVSVFGDLNNDEDAGMDLDELMDEIDAKVVYFPAYACTSFIVGQVMTAFLNNCPSRNPVPAHEGTSVCLGDDATERRAPNATLAHEVLPLVETTPTPSSIRNVDDLLCLSAHSIPDTLILEADDHYAALCVRSSAAYRVPTRSNFLGFLCPMRSYDDEALESLSQDADDEVACSIDDPDSESNVATDGQSSPVPESANATDILPDDSTYPSVSTPRANGSHFHPPEPSTLTKATTNTRILPNVQGVLHSDTRYKFMQSLLSLDSLSANAARRAVTQKYHRLRSSHSVSTRIPCLARAIKQTLSLYVYRDILSSESFMDLSGAH